MLLDARGQVEFGGCVQWQRGRGDVYSVARGCGLRPRARGTSRLRQVQGMEHDVEHITHGLPWKRVPIPEDLSADDVVAACMKHFVAYGTHPRVMAPAPRLPPAAAVCCHFR